MMHDRGAFESIEFRRCSRGFLISTGSRYDGMMGQLFAFDRVEDAAAWLVEQYAKPAEEQGQAEPTA